MHQIEWHGLHDIELMYDEVASMAYDAKTPDNLAEHYHHTLKVVECHVRSFGERRSRYIFLMNPETRKLRIWFD